MSDLTGQELNEHLKAVAKEYNGQNPAGDSPEEIAARIAAHELNQAQGSENHNGELEVRADTPEDIKAREEKAAKEAEEAEAAKTPEEKAAEKKAEEERAAEEEAARLAAETPEEKAKREKAEAATQEEIDNAEWLVTENQSFNAAMSIMKEAGMKPAEAGAIFDKAMQTGNLENVDRAALDAAVGPDKAALILSGFATYVTEAGNDILERTNAVHEVVGGPENWTKMSAWAKAKAKGDETFKGKIQDITEMMNGKNILQAELAAKEFLTMYNGESTNSTITPKAQPVVNVTNIPASEPKSTITPISAREFAEMSMDAERNLRGGARQARLAELSKNRAAGRAKGI